MFVIVSQLAAGILVVQEWPTRSALIAFITTPTILTLLLARVAWGYRTAEAHDATGRRRPPV